MQRFVLRKKRTYSLQHPWLSTRAHSVLIVNGHLCENVSQARVPKHIWRTDIHGTTQPIRIASLYLSTTGTSIAKGESALDVLHDIVTILKNDRTDSKLFWDHSFVSQDEPQILLSSDRHKTGRNTYKFCDMYPKLPSLFSAQITADGSTHSSERQAILNYLITQTSIIDETAVDDLVKKHYRSVQVPRTSKSDKYEESSNVSTSNSLSFGSFAYKMKRICTPLYEELVKLMLEMGAGLGLQTIISLRQDMLLYKKYLKTNLSSHSSAKRKQRGIDSNDNPSETWTATMNEESANVFHRIDVFDHFLRQTLTTQFAPGFLEIRRITYQHSPAATIEIIARYEAVHPVQDLRDLRARLSLRRRVFGLFHPKLVPEYIPVVVLYISLQTTIPSSMSQIHNQEKEQAEAEDGSLPDNTNPLSPSPTVAIFYSISNILTGLSGVGLGEYLIKQAVKKLRQEIPSLDTFSTLSPLPNFRKWVEGKAIATSRNTRFASDGKIAGIDSNDLQQLTRSLDCKPKDALACLIGALEAERTGDRSAPQHFLNGTAGKLINTILVQRILTRLAAQYLINEKHRRKPLDNVARFHIGNGAEVYRLNYCADMSRKGWVNSFGIMVNYKYDLDKLRGNQDRYESDYVIPVHENVKVLME